MLLLVFCWVACTLAFFALVDLNRDLLQRFVGYCVVSVGLLVADAGLKLSVYGGRMVDSVRVPVKKVEGLESPDGILVGGQVPCDCPLCRDNDFPVIMIRSRPRTWTRPLSNDQLN